MSTYISKSFNVDERGEIWKQGIVSILGSDCERSSYAPAASLRRTLSADMSSKKWLADNGLCQMRKTVSSAMLAVPAEDLSSSPSSSSSISEEEEEVELPSQDDVWQRIQMREQNEKSGQCDTWSSILAQKSNGSNTNNLLPPYIHPLVKKSSSSMSEESLHLCTETLGSESGSDWLSLEASFFSQEDGNRKQHEEEDFRESPEISNNGSVKYSSCSSMRSKKSPPLSFPPPLASLATGDGVSLQMQSHRENGRLVVEAVAVPSKNYFHAEREDGRLVLTLVNTLPPVDNRREKEEKREEKMRLQSGVINVHRSALMIKKLIGIENMNPTWPYKFNKKEIDLVEIKTEAKSEPPATRVSRLIHAPPPTSTFNTYNYFWRAKPGAQASVMINKTMAHNKNLKACEQNELLYTLLRSCKEPRRSLLMMWEQPYCIPSS